MKTRTVVCLTVAFVGYGAFMHAAKAWAQAEPMAPVLPMELAMTAMPAMPATPARLALPAMPEIPAMPALPELPSLAGLDNMSIGVGHHNYGPAESCDDLRIRLHDE